MDITKIERSLIDEEETPETYMEEPFKKPKRHSRPRIEIITCAMCVHDERNDNDCEEVDHREKAELCSEYKGIEL